MRWPPPATLFALVTRLRWIEMQLRTIDLRRLCDLGDDQAATANLNQDELTTALAWMLLEGSHPRLGRRQVLVGGPIVLADPPLPTAQVRRRSWM